MQRLLVFSFQPKWKKDEEKFIAYANFIADSFEEAEEERSARIIRKRIDGTYKNEPTVTLD